MILGSNMTNVMINTTTVVWGHQKQLHRTARSRMSVKSMKAAGQGDTMLSLEAFKGQFNVASLIDKIALPVLDQHRQPKALGHKSGPERANETVQDSLQVTEVLLKQFER